MQFINPTPIQALSIPAALEGKDILGTAQTGTGKTGAFAIPMLTNLYQAQVKQALILVPTRELAAQIGTVLRQMSQGLNLRGSLVMGGESFNRQADELYQGADYIVATPGRLNDHLQECTVNLSNVEFVVLDEVDRMLDMGFAPQIRRIMKNIPNQRQTLLFSATLPQEIAAMANTYLKNPIRTQAGSVQETVPQVTTTTIETSQEGKVGIILKEVATRTGKILIFTRTQSRTDRVATLLHREGNKVVCLHGGRTQGQRKQAMEAFRRGTHRILVATDLAGRGIDVSDIAHVINYDIPGNREDYIHRIGRTGRLGKTGEALNLVSPVDLESEYIITGVKPKPKGSFGRRRRRR